MALTKQAFTCILCLFPLMESVCYSEVAARAPDAREWVESLKQSDLEGIVAPTPLIVVSSFGEGGPTGGQPTFKKFNYNACRNVSFLFCNSPKDASYTALLNKGNTGSGVAAAFAVSPAKAAVVLNGDKVLLYGPQLGNPLDMDLPKASFDKLDIRLMTDKVLTAVGYDAVVLAVKEDFILVGSTESRLKRGNIQGLIVAGSSDKWSIAGMKTQGAGLLSLVSRSGGFGVFQLVIQGDSVGSAIPLGTKVLIEANQNKK